MFIVALDPGVGPRRNSKLDDRFFLASFYHEQLTSDAFPSLSNRPGQTRERRIIAHRANISLRSSNKNLPASASRRLGLVRPRGDCQGISSLAKARPRLLNYRLCDVLLRPQEPQHRDAGVGRQPWHT